MDDPPLDNNPGPGSHAEHLNVGDRVIVWIPRLQDGAGGNIRGIIAEKDENSNLFMIRAEGADGGTRSFKNISAADITKVTPRARRPSPAKPRRKTKKKKAKRQQQLPDHLLNCAKDCGWEGCTGKKCKWRRSLGKAQCVADGSFWCPGGRAGARSWARKHPLQTRTGKMWRAARKRPGMALGLAAAAAGGLYSHLYAPRRSWNLRGDWTPREGWQGVAAASRFFPAVEEEEGGGVPATFRFFPAAEEEEGGVPAASRMFGHVEPLGLHEDVHHVLPHGAAAPTAVLGGRGKKPRRRRRRKRTRRRRRRKRTRRHRPRRKHTHKN